NAHPEIARLSVFANGVDPIVYMQGNVNADPGKKDDVIAVSIQTPDPKASAAIANAVVGAYRDYINSSKSNQFGAVLKLLQNQLDTTQANIRAEEAALDEIRRKNPNMSIQADGIGNSPAIVFMNTAAAHYQEIRLLRTDAQITYGPNNPKLRELQ